MLNHSCEHCNPIGWATIPLCDNALYQGLFHSITDIPYCKLASSESVFKAVLGNFTKIQAEKYDFNLYKGFSMEKMAQICQILKKKRISRSPDFFDNFWVSSHKNRRILGFFSPNFISTLKLNTWVGGK